jgi:hypothetical protein
MGLLKAPITNTVGYMAISPEPFNELALISTLATHALY